MMASDRELLCFVPRVAMPLVEMMRMHMPLVYRHSLNTGHLAHAMAQQMEMSSSEVAVLTIGGILHDIGKFAVPDAILNKRGQLSRDEQIVVRKHPTVGEALLRDHREVARARRLVYQHHERIDGEGYPHRLVRHQIDPLARALAVVDAYAALTENRSYHAAVSDEDAVAEIARCSDQQFDPEFVQALLAMDRVGILHQVADLAAGRCCGESDLPITMVG